MELEDELKLGCEVHELRAQYSRAMRPSSLAMVDGRLSMPKARMTFHVSSEDMKRRLDGVSFAKDKRGRGQ